MVVIIRDVPGASIFDSPYNIGLLEICGFA
jgi:hypothetical protein